MRSILAAVAGLALLVGCSSETVRLGNENPVEATEMEGQAVAPQSPETDPSYRDRARVLCEGSGRELAGQYGDSVELLAFHPSTELRLEAWADRWREPGAPRPTPSEPADGSRFLALCYFDGTFNEIPKGPPPGIEPIDYRRISVLAFEDGETRLFAAAPSNRISPSQAPAPPPDE